MSSRNFNQSFSIAINACKGFSILLVVLGHIQSPLGSYIYSFHIPLFFFIGGIFINPENSPIEFFKKNARRILLPYFLFGIVGLVVNSVKEIVLGRDRESVFDELVGIFWWMDIDHLQHYGFVLWFLPALFWARASVFLLIKYLKVNSILLLIFTLIFYSYMTDYPVLPLALDKGASALPWVLSGYVFAKYKQNLLNNSAWVLLFFVGGFWLIYYFNLLLSLDMARNNVGNIYVTFSCVLFIGYFLIFLFFKFDFLVQKSSFLMVFGMESMLVLVLHPYLNNIFHLIIEHYFSGEWYLKFLCTLVVLSSLIALKGKYFENKSLSLLLKTL
ncbi:acyltransferase family protein [Methylomonas sp. YC3]